MKSIDYIRQHYGVPAESREKHEWIENLRQMRAERDAALAAGQNMANALERNCPCYCDHPLRADLPPCSRCSSLAAWRSVSGSERTDDDRND